MAIILQDLVTAMAGRTLVREMVQQKYNLGETDDLYSFSTRTHIMNVLLKVAFVNTLHSHYGLIKK